MKKYDVLDIGIIVVDMPVKIPYPVLDFAQDTIRVEKIDLLPGGDAANSSIVLSQLGKKVALAGALGADGMGVMIREAIRAKGVDVHAVRMKEGVQTSTSVVLINSRGDRTFVCTKGNNETLCMQDMDAGLLSDTRHVNISSLFAHPLFEKEGGASFLEQAKNVGATVSADAGHDNYKTGFEGVAPLLKFVDIFMPSYGEARYMSRESSPERQARFFVDKTGEKTVLIKLGAEGCYVYHRKKSFTLPGFKVEAKDTTGAGDNFLAGFLSAYLDGEEIGACARFACAVAADSTLHMGATAPHIDMANIQKLFKTGGGIQ